MVYEISLKVQVHIDVPGWRDDIPLEFYSTGANYAEVRAGTQEFVKDYIAYHQIKNIKSIEYIYADKHGVIKEKIEEILDKI